MGRKKDKKGGKKGKGAPAAAAAPAPAPEPEPEEPPMSAHDKAVAAAAAGVAAAKSAAEGGTMGTRSNSMPMAQEGGTVPLSRIVFDKYSKGKDYLDISDFESFARDRGYWFDKTEWKAFVASIDRNNDSRINYEEFLEFWKTKSRFAKFELNEEQRQRIQLIEEVFNDCDVDGDGVLSRDANGVNEVEMLYEKMVEAGYPEEYLGTVDDAFAEIDANGDGVIEFGEFLGYLINKWGVLDTE